MLCRRLTVFLSLLLLTWTCARVRAGELGGLSALREQLGRAEEEAAVVGGGPQPLQTPGGEGYGFGYEYEFGYEEREREKEREKDLLTSFSVLRSRGHAPPSAPLPPQVPRPPRKRMQQRPPLANAGPKRSPQGSRFALSLDVPTSILSILLDLAKARDLRAKAAANAEVMARIGRRK
ncbi:urocortin 3, like [Amia ocellicauda]|uniref:urocortin 3, like n=1 Tax=Amia ocellicauda TaxID=2972642 RepID=UPI0034648B77